MTIQRTREIFGVKMKHLTDAEVLEFMTSIGVLCDDLLNSALHQLTAPNSNSKTN